MELLRNLPAAGSGGRLYGRVRADEKAGGATPLPGVTILPTVDERQTIRTIANERIALLRNPGRGFQASFQRISLNLLHLRAAQAWPAYNTSAGMSLFVAAPTSSLLDGSVGFEQLNYLFMLAISGVP
jgi:hypothetical protein